MPSMHSDFASKASAEFSRPDQFPKRTISERRPSAKADDHFEHRRDRRHGRELAGHVSPRIHLDPGTKIEIEDAREAFCVEAVGRRLGHQSTRLAQQILGALLAHAFDLVLGKMVDQLLMRQRDAWLKWRRSKHRSIRREALSRQSMLTLFPSSSIDGKNTSQSPSCESQIN